MNRRVLGIHLELFLQGHAVAIVALGLDAVEEAEILAGTCPGNGEIAAGIHSHAGLSLGAVGQRIHLEGVAHGQDAGNHQIRGGRVDYTHGGKLLRVDVAQTCKVFPLGNIALPGDHEIAVGVHRYRRTVLVALVDKLREGIVRFRGIDAELGARLLHGLYVQLRRTD